MAHAKKVFHVVLGIFLLMIGVAGLVLPILNGTVFLLLGFILLSFEIPYVEERLESITQKNNTLHHFYKKLQKWMKKLFRKL